ncbi:MAG: amidohydrolase family protein [Acidimicrobiales bacterium]
MPPDLVIRNGLIIDCSGCPGFHGSVAMQDGTIRSVGQVDERGQRELDATDLVITPGVIDAHTHMDAQVFWDPLGTPSCWHGVTTVVMGNCGFTLAPVHPGFEHLVVRNLKRAEDISAAAMHEGIPWGWEHFAEYLGAVDGLPKEINVAAYIGHSALRTSAMGERAFSEVASEDDLRLMGDELRSALQAGAMGFTSSRNVTHETSGGRPVASRLADWEEVRSLVADLSGARSAAFELSLEDAAKASGRPEQREFFDRLRDLATHVAPGSSGRSRRAWRMTCSRSGPRSAPCPPKSNGVFSPTR